MIGKEGKTKLQHWSGQEEVSFFVLDNDCTNLYDKMVTFSGKLLKLKCENRNGNIKKEKGPVGDGRGEK